ncbi:MAG: hypothetical protein JWO31_3881 [Phycisphaerales bacterium]|nr:hypothetical protein [Phycisphaerales bacterium]
MAAVGAHAFVTGHAVYGRAGMELHLAGVNAAAFGVAAVSAAVFLHCHYFWGNVYDQVWFAVLGKIVAAAGVVGGLGTLIVRVGVLGTTG